jgi:hypothetical protein
MASSDRSKGKETVTLPPRVERAKLEEGLGKLDITMKRLPLWWWMIVRRERRKSGCW